MEISRLLGEPAPEESPSAYEPEAPDKAQHATPLVVSGAPRCVGPNCLVKRKRRRRPTAKQLHAKNQRDADNSLILNLTLDVNDLRQQVHDCLVQRSLRETRLLVARQQFHARSLQSVTHFFQLFRHGYPSILTATEQRYLRQLLDDNIVVAAGVRGQDAFYEQWRRYKQLFSVRRLTNLSAAVVTSDAGGCLIECSGQFEGRVTAAALETVFPHVLGDEALVESLLHRRFVCPTKTLISFDASGRLVQYDAFSDVFKAMSELLDFNPLRVVRLMENAVISEGSLLPPVDGCVNAEEDGSYDVDDEAQAVPPPASGTAPSSRASIDFLLS